MGLLFYYWPQYLASFPSVFTFTFTLQRTLASYQFTEVVHSSPAITSIMIVVGHVAKGMKYMFTTNQVRILQIRYVLYSELKYISSDYINKNFSFIISENSLML